MLQSETTTCIALNLRFVIHKICNYAALNDEITLGNL